VVNVARVSYPVQHLSMARGTARLYNYPGVEKEERVIGAAIRSRSDERLWHGDWMVPSRGRISTAFGERRLRNGKYVGRHRGLDIAAPKGAPVLAAADGKVVLTGMFRKHGGTVVIDHGHGITSLYLHQSRIHARKGETVSRGDQVGEVGATGVATGPHLHWSVYVQGTPVEPLEFVRLSRRGIRP
jgi:murein DD-endopeptidase MepM/ murein hydrolase activator NlpD